MNRQQINEARIDAAMKRKMEIKKARATLESNIEKASLRVAKAKPNYRGTRIRLVRGTYFSSYIGALKNAAVACVWLPGNMGETPDWRTDSIILAKRFVDCNLDLCGREVAK